LRRFAGSRSYQTNTAEQSANPGAREKKYRFRFINISTNSQGMRVSLRNANGPVEWLNIAKDGPALPADTLRPSKAQTYLQSGGKPTTVSLQAQWQTTCCSIFFYPSRKSTRTQTLSFVSPTAAAQ